MITIDLNKQQTLTVNPKAIQKINFTGNLDGNNNRLTFFIIEEVKKKKHFTFFTRNCESIVNMFNNFILF